jgi:hypothetical protein
VKGALYNSSIMIGEDGDTVNYNKVYLPAHKVFEERR